jgi:glucose/arabinose dehydrogenase
MASPRQRALALLALSAAAAAPVVYGDWHLDKPGVEHRILPQDMPPAFATRSTANGPSLVRRPEGAVPQAPPGFTVQLYAAGLEGPRVIRVAPNGDVFVAESYTGRVRVFRAADGSAQPAASEVFAAGLNVPYGIAFYPPGPAPQYVYIGEVNQVVRFPYRSGAPKPSGPAEIVLPGLPTGGHVTRDLVVAPDGQRLFLAIGSGSNDPALPARTPDQIQAIEAALGRGAAWGGERNRADVIALDPSGQAVQHYANGLRNCSGEAIQPATGALWCAVNERDGLGDDLPPDYVTRVPAGAFYGWPWYYIGDHENPRHKGERPDLAGHVAVPDVLIQPHSAPLGLAFYEGAMFPAEYRGDAFVALHGSWNRRQHTGYKVIRVRLHDGKPTGGYEDFLTGFVSDAGVWGRPVGVAVAHDGALLVTEDGNGTIWRVGYAR